MDAAHFPLILELCRGGAVTLKRLFFIIKLFYLKVYIKCYTIKQ